MKKLWKELQHQILKMVVPALGVIYFYVIGKTSKTILLGQEHHAELRRQYPHFIYVGWHEQILNGGWPLRLPRGKTLLISQSRDGEYISRIVHGLGYRTVRGSSSRGGVQALLQLLHILKEQGDVIMVADGPRGPARECKPGVLGLAKQSGRPIIPIAISASRCKRVKSWDRTMIPLPFGTLTMIHGEPLLIPADADDDALTNYQAQLTHALDALAAKINI